MPDRVFEALLEATGSLDWSSADQVKRRGRQRARRRRVAVVAASLALVIGVGGGMMSVLRTAGGPPWQPSLTTPSASTPTVTPTGEPTPPQPSSPVATPTADRSHNAPIPEAAWLTARDLGTPVTVSDDPLGGDGTLTAVLAYCGDDGLAPFVKEATTQSSRAFVAGGDLWASQRASRRAGNASVQFVSQLTRSARACRPQDPTRRVTVVEEGFVGEASVLLTTSAGSLHSVFVLFVAGGVEVQLFFKNSTDKNRARELAGLLANRLG